MKYFLPPLVVLVLRCFSAAAQPELVQDINTTPAGSVPSFLTTLNGTVYFSAANAAGRGLWKSDGTPGGTVLVKDFFPGKYGEQFYGPQLLTPAGNRVFFSAFSARNGFELWQSDGTPTGTVLVKDINPGPGSSYIASATELNGALLFTVSNERKEIELWKSDGTAEGTGLVKDFGTGGNGPPITGFGLGTGRNQVFFMTLDGIWRSDGTAAGTILLKTADDVHTSFTQPVEVGGATYFMVNNSFSRSIALWRSDGTERGTYEVKQLSVRGFGPLGNFAKGVINGGGTLYFWAEDDEGVQLWKSNGTAAGTVLVKSFAVPSSFYWGPRLPVYYQGNVYFVLNAARGELWKSDGTPAGTVPVAALGPEGEITAPMQMVAAESGLFFGLPSDKNDSRNLWKTDGTTASTVQLGSITLPRNDFSPWQPWVVSKGMLFFVAFDQTVGSELWMSDGTVAGTRPVKDIHPGSYGISGVDAWPLNGALLFTACEQGGIQDGLSLQSLYKTNSQAGSAPVLVPPAAGSPPRYNGAKTMGDQLFYVKQGELRKNNGTAGGDVLIRYFRDTPRLLTPVNGVLYFVAEDVNQEQGEELWKTDGTAAGTTLVKDIVPGQNRYAYLGMAAVNGTLFFLLNDNAHGFELWKSNGTAAGTAMVRDVHPGLAGSAASFPVYYRGKYYFTADDGTNGRELWVTDGTPAGTRMVLNIAPGATDALAGPLAVNPADNFLYLAANDGVHGRELWKSDGTAAGTVLVKDIHPGGNGSPAAFSMEGNTLFFTADDGVHGRELWKTDGTASGTALVKDIAAGPADGVIHDFNETMLGTGKGLYFTGSDGVHGDELWWSNGTEDGTVLVADLFAGPESSFPAQLRPVDDVLFLLANDGVHGEELWRYPLPDLVTTAAASTVCAGAAFPVRFANAGNVTFGAGNVFTVQLSDANGSFAAPTAIGTLAAAQPGPVAVTIPADVPAGARYRIRVIASEPTRTGAGSGAPVVIHGLPVAAITADGVTLTATPAAGYRWYLDGQPLPETTRTIQARKAGSYVVEVTSAEGCTARSAALAFEVTGFESPGAARVQVYPNPTGGSVTLAFGDNAWQGATVSLHGPQGQVLQTNRVPTAGNPPPLRIDLAPYPAGLYLLHLEKDGRLMHRKIQKL